MSDYEPGTFAMVTVDGNEYPAVRGRSPFDKSWYINGPILGSRSSFSDAQVSNVRPFVAIDPAEITTPDETGDQPPGPEIVECLRRLAEQDHNISYRRRVAERIADAFERQTKPAEPKATGAIVHDSDTEAWVRHSNGEWACLQSKPGDDVRRWDDLCGAYGPIEVEQP